MDLSSVIEKSLRVVVIVESSFAYVDLTFICTFYERARRVCVSGATPVSEVGRGAVFRSFHRNGFPSHRIFHHIRDNSFVVVSVILSRQSSSLSRRDPVSSVFVYRPRWFFSVFVSCCLTLSARFPCRPLPPFFVFRHARVFFGVEHRFLFGF